MPNTPPRPKPATPDMAVFVMQLCCISLMNFIVFCCALPHTSANCANKITKQPKLRGMAVCPGGGVASTNHLYGVGIIGVHVAAGASGHAR